MRPAASFGALLASSLLHKSAAQANGYGSPETSPEGGQQGGPGNNPENDATATLGSISSGTPNGPSCLVESTTTVFVTVYPTSPASPAGGSGPEASGPDGTLQQTIYPTTTITVSPTDSPAASQPSVKPFTTLTIDIWGVNSSPEENSGTLASDVGSSTSITDSNLPSQASSVGAASGYGPDSSGSWPNPAESSDSSGPEASPQGTVAGGNYPSGGQMGYSNNSPDGTFQPASATAISNTAGSGQSSSGYTVVTDTDVIWTTDASGPTQVTVLSEHTITFGSPSNSVEANSQPTTTCVTITGPDGRQTVIEWPAATLQSVSVNPASTSLGFPNSPGSAAPQAASTTVYPYPGTTLSSIQGESTASPGPGFSTTCTTFTILGSNGLPTIVHSSWVVPQSPATSEVSGPLPSDGSNSKASQTVFGGAGFTTFSSYTILGSDGMPTVVESTLVLPTASKAEAGVSGDATTGATVQITAAPSSLGTADSGNSGLQGGGGTTCATYTFIGSDGLPTVVDTTYTIPGPATANPDSGLPQGAASNVPAQFTVLSGVPQAGGVNTGLDTTCITYTVLGFDGNPTVKETTMVVAATAKLPTASSVSFPSLPSQPNVNGLPQGLPGFTSSPGLLTTCLTIDVLGTDGVVTPVVETVVITTQAAASVATPDVPSIGFPSMAPPQQQTFIPQGISAAPNNIGGVTTCITVDIVGPNGIKTPVAQTVVVTPSAGGIGLPSASPMSVEAVPPTIQSGFPAGGVSWNTPLSVSPSLGAYGQNAPKVPTLLPPSASVSGLDTWPTATITGTRTSVLTLAAGPNQAPSASEAPQVSIPAYGGPGDLNSPGFSSGVGQPLQNGNGWSPTNSGLYGQISPPFKPQGDGIVTAIQSETWTNVIPELTTTYTMNFPLTTLATLTIPRSPYQKRHAFRRQESFSSLESPWGNFTPSASPQSVDAALGTSSTPLPPLASQSVQSSSSGSRTEDGDGFSAMCPSGDKVGNLTVTFDDIKTGPLFNPSGDIWFSEGFLVAPPPSQSSQSYRPSSGGQLVEFVPSSLSSTAANLRGTSDEAEIGAGPNSANSCFRFNFFGMNLGCAATGNEQWCDFTFSAYAYNSGSSTEQSIAWSETKRVPACPNFPSDSCTLTPVELEGYNNITSILISLRVGLEARAWWGDDIKFGWTDNSCDAATCRAQTAPQPVKRETVESALQRGVWHWTPAGLQRLADEYIWESMY